MAAAENTSIEQQIIRVAKQVFIEKGFEEAGMSEIAARVGINRSGLHYYYRTKEKMFEAVYADIVLSFIPSVHRIILQDKPIEERLGEMIDVYFDVFRRDPFLPVFFGREVQRDAYHIYQTFCKLGINQYGADIKNILRAEMQKGTARKVRIEFLMYTFYGLIIFPFLSRPLFEIVFKGEMDFEKNLQEWKAHIIRQMIYVLLPQTPSPAPAHQPD